MWKGALCALILALVAALVGPVVVCLTYPSSYLERRTPHPKSPHTPPSLNLTPEQLQEFHDAGYLVIRGALPPEVAKNMAIGGDDIEKSPTMQCGLAPFVGPPIFHSYKPMCNWPGNVHDYFRDVLYHSPLAHLASQIMDSKEVRMINALLLGSQADKTLPLRWHADYPAFVGKGTCNNGVVMWMPLEHSHRTRNGMIFQSGSHKEFEESISNGTLPAGLAAVSWMRDTFGPRAYQDVDLQLGDVVIFSKCTMHSASGDNSARGARRGYQLRFISEDTFDEKMDAPFPGIGEKFGEGIRSIRAPRLWPASVVAEDTIRAAGHLTNTRSEWLALMFNSPKHFALTLAIRFAELHLGIFL